jgi:adenosylhomocysteinase
MMASPKYNIKEISLAETGRQRIDWAFREMPVLGLIRKRFAKEKPLDGISFAGCAHITTETANLAITLKAGGASVTLTASNPLSTDDSAAAALVKDHGMSVYAVKGESVAVYNKSLIMALDSRPQLLMDDGGDLISTVLAKRPALVKNIIGAAEETTTGVSRLRNMEREGVLRFPVFAVNAADTKRLFDNRYGTGQSTIDGITRATNILWAGKKVVVCGYGWVGRGIAMRARGLGANVIVTEVEPVRALEAVMEGYGVMPLLEAAKTGDIFITVTGDKNVIGKGHMQVMKDGAILANSGHFDIEIDIPALESLSKSKRRIRSSVDEYALKDGRRLYLLGEGRLINLAAAEGHPASVMDMSFANQALCAEYMVKHKGKMEIKVNPVPEEIDKEVARLKLKTMGVAIDKLTAEQKKYLSSWQEGT